MFESGHVDLDIRFKVVLKNQFQMSLVDSRNFTFHAESHRYHENGLRTGKVQMVDKLTKGYDRTTLEAHFLPDNTRDEDSKTDIDGETNDEPVNIVFTEKDLPKLKFKNSEETYESLHHNIVFTEEDLQNFDIGMGCYFVS